MDLPTSLVFNSVPRRAVRAHKYFITRAHGRQHLLQALEASTEVQDRAER
jgi:hypothetical protein